MGSRLFVDAPSGASDMVLAVEIQLPGNAPSHSPTWLALLVERAASGDTAAFEQIMIHSQRRVMAMTWRMLGNEADARDASQEVFLRVYKHLGRFRQDQEFFAWLYRITVNVCRDLLKQRQHQSDRFRSLGGDSEETLEIPFEHESAEQALIQAQRRELISRALATLPFKERASIVLRDVEGLSTDEVARVLKSSSTTVRSQISSGRRKIRAYCRRYLKLEQES
ncbi:MAG TPA: sigma-70 family RNA polymerase sigma factor [Blastocatellia bacterium]|nr:sigma-70 family RNA polymerase sigma factor [Blastocatellia bacterium]